MEGVPGRLPVLELPAEPRPPPRLGGVRFFWELGQRRRTFEYHMRSTEILFHNSQQSQQLATSNPTTMNKAEAVSPSMSLSSELSDSPLLSVTRTFSKVSSEPNVTPDCCVHHLILVPFFFFFSICTGVFFPSSSSSSSFASSSFCFSSSLSSSLSDASSIPRTGENIFYCIFWGTGL